MTEIVNVPLTRCEVAALVEENIEAAQYHRRGTKEDKDVLRFLEASTARLTPFLAPEDRHKLGLED